MFQKVKFILAYLAFFLFLPCPAQAKVFKNNYISFSLPSHWECELEETEYVCGPKLAKGRRADRIIIFAAKIAGGLDSLVSYKRHLGGNLSKGKGSSLVTPPSLKKIGEVAWVDATHLGSEIDEYYTRYLATVWDGIAILVTFTAHKRKFKDVQIMFFRAIQTLKVNPDWRSQYANPQ